MPLLIYVILQAKPEHFVSNAQYILRFRNQDKLTGEAGYYVSSLVILIPSPSSRAHAHWFIDGGDSVHRKP